MLTRKSPRKVMMLAHWLADGVIPDRTSKFSRKDYALPQLFACLAVKELRKCSYRDAEDLLRDAEHWCHAIGMRKVPDHNTLQRASVVLLGKYKVDRLLDAMARLASVARVLGLSRKPLAGDGSHYEPRHVSRYFEARRGRGTGVAGRRRKAKAMPKLAVGVAAGCHLVLSLWAGAGSGGDHPHFERILFDAWRRVPNRRFKAAFDAGFDSERAHPVAREEMGLATLIPPTAGRPSRGGPAAGRPLAAPHGPAAADQGVPQAVRLHAAVAGRGGQLDDEAEPRQRAPREDRRQPRAGPAAEGPHAQPHDPEVTARVETEQSRSSFCSRISVPPTP